jgi:aminoglycoside phosphotransferase (APT) family kinase protein
MRRSRASYGETVDIPSADIAVDAALAARLVAAQFPRLSAPVTLAAEGWDNMLFRLGERLAIRIPRRAVAAMLIEHEQAALPVPQRLVRLRLPVPVAVGRPSPDYPFAWSIIPWVEGTGGAQRDRYAGQRALWDAGAAAAPHAGPPVWLHGDAHPGNVVTDAADGLATVVDFGDVTSGDPATDLAAAWLHFTAAGRAEFHARYGALRETDAASWARARAWAVSIGTAALAASDGTGAMAQMGRDAIGQLLAGD